MAILIDKNSRILCQGITGKAGSFHTHHCLEYGTNIVSGVTPGKGGQVFEKKVPVFDTVEEAVKKTDADTSMIFVPARFAARIFSLIPPTGNTLPRRVISPVIAKCFLTFCCVKADAIDVIIVTPAEGPSFGMAPSGT